MTDSGERQEYLTQRRREISKLSDKALLECIEPTFDWDAMAATHVPARLRHC